MSLLKFCENHEHLFIYGAGKRGVSVKNMIGQNGFKIEAYIVSNTDSNPKKIENIDVLSLDQWKKVYSEANGGILIAASDKYVNEITHNLLRAGIKSFFCVNNEICQEFRRETDNVKNHNLLSSVEPVSRLFGFDRGTPIDRYYMDKFLTDNTIAMPNPQNTFEVGESTYSEKFYKNANHEILMFEKGMDLTRPETIRQNYYDVFICTQVFNFIYDVKDAIRAAFSLLRDGGIMLCTVAGNISQVSRSDMENYGHFWGFTYLGIQRLVEETFGVQNVKVFPYGNAMAATAFIQGVAVEDLEEKEKLDMIDPDYAITVGIVAKKRG